MFDKITIIAPGLLGASVAMAAQKLALAKHIAVWARRAEAREQLATRDWCDSAPESIGEACSQSDFIVLCAPVERIIDLAKTIAPDLDSKPIVTDVGSVKADIVAQCVEALGANARFVGSHPMAGSEKTGMDNGCADLFEDRSCFVTANESTDAEAAEKTIAFWQALGSSIVETSPEIHDETVAKVSHLPHILASSLSDYLAQSIDGTENVCGNGLRDTTRIASGDPQLWKEIISQNRSEILRALSEFQDHLQHFQSAIANQEDFEVLKRLADAKAFRDSL